MTEPQNTGIKLQEAVNHLMANKVEGFLWIVRLTTVVFTILFLIPIFGMNPYSAFYKALIANAATSALRLHQRLPRVQLNRHFFSILLLEDSFHYLFYSLIFIFCYPTILVLFPVFFFALLHSACYSLVILEKMNAADTSVGRLTRSFVNRQQRHILKLVSYIEIFLMPMVVMMMFNGKGTLMTTILYYHFLTLRYSSRRNPYTRSVFLELRIILQTFANQNNCPNILRNIIFKMISFFVRMAPAAPQN